MYTEIRLGAVSIFSNRYSHFSNFIIENIFFIIVRVDSGLYGKKLRNLIVKKLKSLIVFAGLLYYHFTNKIFQLYTYNGYNDAGRRLIGT